MTMTLLGMTARTAQLGRPPLAYQPHQPVSQSAGKAYPDEAGSKPPSNWGAYVHEHEAAERRKFFSLDGRRVRMHACKQASMGRIRIGQGQGQWRGRKRIRAMCQISRILSLSHTVISKWG